MKQLILVSALGVLLFSCTDKDKKKGLEFQVTVPADTPVDDFIYVKVYGPKAFQMTQIDDYTYSYTLQVEPDQDIYYAYQRNDIGQQTVESTPLEPAGGNWDQLRHVKISDKGKTVHDVVTSWRWLEEAVPTPPPSLAATSDFVARVNNEEFQTGVEMYDYYWPGFLELTDRAARHQLENNMKWVLLSVNPAVQATDDGSFAINYATDGQYNEEGLRAQIKIYRSYGINVKITMGMLNETVPNNPSESYWDQRFAAYTEYLKWLGAIAQDEGVSEVSVISTETLPGYGNAPTSNTARWVKATTGLRSVFKGRVSYVAYLGTAFDKLFPLDNIAPILDQFDSLGLIVWDAITTMDNPTVNDLQAAVATQFDKYLKPFWETYQKPIFIEQLAYTSAEKGYLGSTLYPADDPRTSTFNPPDPSVKTDLTMQANIYEAFMREVAARPYISGVFIFGQPYWKSIDRNMGVWGKPAESILSGWYAKP